MPTISSMTLNLGYSREKFNNVTGAFENGKGSGFAAHLVYPLSKRTALYGEMNNGKTQTAAATPVVTKVSRWGMGIRHDF